MRFIGAMMSPADEPRESLAVGGQAVMEGIMMRNGAHLALAIRRADGSITALRRPWITLFSGAVIHIKWFRGFPILLETMVNGIKALNISAELSGEPEAKPLQSWQMIVTLLFAFGLAFALFVVTPHLITLLLSWLSLSGGVEKISFHIWDGLIKFLMFLGYIAMIGRIPDIRRVFEYHGAEHKTIAAYEHGKDPVTADIAQGYSRLHPRCGTTFLLFVLIISIMLHAILVPLGLWIWTPQNAIVKQLCVLFFKLLLIVPISAIAYEAIRWASRGDSGTIGSLMRMPGLMLQTLTTREPSLEQLDVGLVALKEALGDEADAKISTPEYTYLEQ